MGNCIYKSSKNGKFYCRATTYEQCKGKKCSFYISKDGEKLAKEKVYKRLRNLPDEVQESISNTYYKGAMPWA